MTALVQQGRGRSRVHFSNDRTPDRLDARRFAAVLRHAPEAFVSIDREGRVVDWNLAAAALFGWTEEEAHGQELADLIIPRHVRGLHRTAVRRVGDPAESRLLGTPLEMEAVTKQGRTIPVELTVRAVELGADDRVFAAFIRDARRRRALEEAGQHERALTDAVLDVADVAMAACDEAGRLVLCNGLARDVLGPVTGTGWQGADGLLAADGRTPLQPPEHPLARALAGTQVEQQVVVAERPDQQARTLVCDAAAVLDLGGRLIGAVLTMVDVTDRDLARRESRDLEALAQLTRTTEPATTLRTLVEAVVERTGAASAAVWQPEDGVLVPTASAGDGDRRRDLAEAAFADGRRTSTERAVAEPLHGSGGVTGVLVCTWELPPREEAVGLVRVLAEHAEASLVRAGLVADLERLATTDELTGLPNRRAWEAALARAMALARRHGTPFCVAVLDLDFFKRYNDTHGHLAGDRLLRAAAETWQAELRPNDVLARWGGEEFILLLPHTQAAGAVEVVERLRDRTPPPCTSSAGVVEAEPGDDAQDLLGRADEALYAAKRGGRDRTALWGADVSDRPVAAVEHDPAIRALTSAVWTRDRPTAVHCSAVRALAGAVARELGLDPEEVAETERVALLHDLGKLFVPDAVLHKPGPLDEREWELMREHPQAGSRLVASVPGLEDLAPAIEAEHERWDGAGYPRGLAGEAIPLAARITAVCDAFHAMTTDRPYRQALPRELALQEIAEQAGRQFDPRAAEALLNVAA